VRYISEIALIPRTHHSGADLPPHIEIADIAPDQRLSLIIMAAVQSESFYSQVLNVIDIAPSLNLQLIADSPWPDPFIQAIQPANPLFSLAGQPYAGSVSLLLYQVDAPINLAQPAGKLATLAPYMDNPVLLDVVTLHRAGGVRAYADETPLDMSDASVVIRPLNEHTYPHPFHFVGHVNMWNQLHTVDYSVNPGLSNHIWVDDIPEPASLALLAMLLPLCARRRARR